MEKPGELLKKFRRKNNLSGKEMSKIFNCTQQNISAIETGIKKISENKIKILQSIMTTKEFENLLESINYYNSPKIIQEIILKKNDEKIINYFNDCNISIEDKEKTFYKIQEIFFKMKYSE